MLERDFFGRSTLEVAEELIGKKLCFGEKSGLITETEAYIGQDDPACHAARGMTKRNAVMFGPPGYAYVYLIYGMYYCLNLVTEREGLPAAVLIRGMVAEEDGVHYDGPGKMCRYLEMTTAENGRDVCYNNDFCVEKGLSEWEVERKGRIGIKKGTDRLWRFVAVEKGGRI